MKNMKNSSQTDKKENREGHDICGHMNFGVQGAMLQKLVKQAEKKETDEQKLKKG